MINDKDKKNQKTKNSINPQEKYVLSKIFK